MTHNIKTNKRIRKPDNPAGLQEKLKSIPETAGIYKFLNKKGVIIYIGKSINLKKRITQYFNFNHNSRHPRTLLLIRDIAEISWEETHSELLALLREDELIKEHWPEYNVKQKEFLKYIYLTFTRDKFPKLRIVFPDNILHGQHIFGPFRDRYYLEEFLKVLYELFPLRRCKNLNEKTNCIQYDIGQCAGPCRDAVTKKEYDKIVQDAIDFMHGTNFKSLSPIVREMKEHSAGLDFEKARECKRKLDMYYFYARRQKFFKVFRKSILLINEMGLFENAFIFKNGILLHHQREKIFFNTFDVTVIPAQGAETEPEHEWRIIDRANVIYSWINDKKNKKDIFIKQT
ncbi:GIY-YIG nuclease family protein [candidate division KSB1 bacterium]|nr:GIY-YIG nuclease family protein [candidate division KSB1 bacterium]